MVASFYKFESHVHHALCFLLSLWVFIVWIFFHLAIWGRFSYLGDRFSAVYLSQWSGFWIPCTLYCSQVVSVCHLSFSDFSGFYPLILPKLGVYQVSSLSGWIWFLQVRYTSYCLLYGLIIQTYSRNFAVRCIVIFEGFEKWRKKFETFAS